MKPTKLVVALLVIASTTLHAEPEIKGTAAELAQHLNAVPRTVNLTGEAEIKVAADRAITSVRVVTESKSLQEASRANQELRAKMLRDLALKGIAPDQVKAARFSSTPKYGVFGDKAKSYRVENIVKITAQDEKEFQAVAALVDAIPELRYDSIELEHSDKEGLKQRAVAQALDKIVEKSRFYQDKLGVKLTPKGFNEGQVVPVLPMAGRDYYKLANSYAKMPAPSSLEARDVAGAETEETSTPFGELVYRAVVTVEYDVESK